MAFWTSGPHGALLPCSGLLFLGLGVPGHRGVPGAELAPKTNGSTLCLGASSSTAGETPGSGVSCGTAAPLPSSPVETLLQAQALLKEARENPTRGLRILPIDLDSAILINITDGSWANAVGHRTQAGYCIFVAEPQVVKHRSPGLGSLVDWRSHRLRRSVHCTLYAEAMASRAGGAAATWCRLFFLEVLMENFKGTDAVLKNMDDVELLKLHSVTDCNSLHECVVKSGLPEDKRAAVEILAIREMTENSFGNELSEDEFNGETRSRLKESTVAEFFHWTSNEFMKADILTKKSSVKDRELWLKDLNRLELHTLKKADVAAARPVASRPRPRLDRAEARRIIAAASSSTETPARGAST